MTPFLNGLLRTNQTTVLLLVNVSTQLNLKRIGETGWWAQEFSGHLDSGKVTLQAEVQADSSLGLLWGLTSWQTTALPVFLVKRHESCDIAVPLLDHWFITALPGILHTLHRLKMPSASHHSNFIPRQQCWLAQRRYCRPGVGPSLSQPTFPSGLSLYTLYSILCKLIHRLTH